jgi:hypothetical protein
MLRDCPIDHRCMTAITPEEVFLRAVEMLAHQQCDARPAGDHLHDAARDAAAGAAAVNEARVRPDEATGDESTREVGAEVA